jgi:hypothetical protein
LDQVAGLGIGGGELRLFAGLDVDACDFEGHECPTASLVGPAADAAPLTPKGHDAIVSAESAVIRRVGPGG